MPNALESVNFNLNGPECSNELVWIIWVLWWMAPIHLHNLPLRVVVPLELVTSIPAEYLFDVHHALILSDNVSQFPLVFKTIEEHNDKLAKFFGPKRNDLENYNIDALLEWRGFYKRLILD